MLIDNTVHVMDNTIRELADVIENMVETIEYLPPSLPPRVRGLVIEEMMECISYDIHPDKVKVTFRSDKARPKMLDIIRSYPDLGLRLYHVYLVKELTIYPIILLENGIIRNTGSSLEPIAKDILRKALMNCSSISLPYIDRETRVSLKDVPDNYLSLSTRYKLKRPRKCLSIDVLRKDEGEFNGIEQFVIEDVCTYYI